MPPIRTLRSYRRADFPRDLVAGLTVSVVDIPQSMAFAVIAGVPPVYGLYTAIFLAAFGSLFTSSPFLSVGPTNTQSLLIAAVVSRVTHDPHDYVRLVIALGMIKGLLQLAFAAASMGRLVRYVSRGVMIGFTAGAGVLIFLEQVPAFLGLPGHVDRVDLPGAVGRAASIATHVAAANPVAVALGAAALALLLFARKLPEWVPAPLIVVAGGAAAVWLGGLDVPTVGPLPRGLPSVRLPRASVSEIEALLPGALAIALLGMLESVAIAKSIAQRTGQRISADQEFFGQGIANVLGSLFSCMPGSGSFTRTALQYQVGARTRVAGLVCAVSNAIIFLALAPLARHIPLAVLAAILFYVAYTLIDVPAILRMVRTSRADAVTCLGTFAAALLLPLAYAIYVGVFLNIALYLRQAGKLRMARMVYLGGQSFQEVPVESMAELDQDVVFLQLEGDLFFAVEEELSARLGELAASDVKVAVFRLKRTHFVDGTVLFAFAQFIQLMQKRGGHVLFCGVRPDVMRQLEAFGLVDLIGRDNVFPASDGVFNSARRALERARVLTGHTERGGVTGAYQI